MDSRAGSLPLNKCCGDPPPLLDPQQRPSDPNLEGDPSHSDSRSESGSEDDDPRHQPGVPEPDVFHQPEVLEPVPIAHLNEQPVLPSATGKYDPNK